MSDTPKRPWYQFSLRTLLVAMMGLCVGPGGFVAYEQNKARRQKAAVEAIEKLGGDVEYGRTIPVRSVMLRQILGDDRFAGVESIDFWNPSRLTDADLTHLSGMKHLKTLHLDYSQVTDGGLKHLSGLKSLAHLYLNNSQVTDAGLKHLAELKSLLGLNLYNSQVTDAGVAELQKTLPKCKIYR